MSRPPADLDDYLEWQQRLESCKESGLSIDEFCLQEGISRATYYRWVGKLQDGIPPEILQEETNRDQAESGESLFLPVALKTAPIEMELANGCVIRLPLGLGKNLLLEALRTVGNFPPRRAKS